MWHTVSTGLIQPIFNESLVKSLKKYFPHSLLLVGDSEPLSPAIGMPTATVVKGVGWPFGYIGAEQRGKPLISRLNKGSNAFLNRTHQRKNSKGRADTYRAHTPGRQRSKDFIFCKSSNPHNYPVREILYIISVLEEKTEGQRN